MDLTALTDIELETQHVAIQAEYDRRSVLAAIPEQVAVLSLQYLAAGGNQSNLDAAIVPAAEEATTTA
ncbi:hypothetical protein [Cryobacterium sp. PH31-O1]|uniref:hypothetical protein n=1 Tax=Cryobacterium sp. PH31-O1 TaxID=3046306 RepID=UPI0024B88CF7|nr:hypothetical protein [Cryobacterium sp. PH31-O1]MDJ0337483.1 hypothetical protein [Cryobacterium sp. PH31-O1]